MLRRNREIVIFNLSAIDLFCSGMGAVMVLMVLLMPYYGKKAPIPPVVTPPPLAVVTPPAPEPLKPEPVKPTPIAPEPGVMIRDLELMIVIDTTSSMKDQIDDLRTTLGSTIKVLSRLSENLKVGVVAYRDRGDLYVVKAYPLTRVKTTDASAKPLKEFIDGLVADGGGDTEEAVDEALTAATGPGAHWTRIGELPKRSRQVILIVGDAPGHDSGATVSSKIAREWHGVDARRKVCCATSSAATPYFKQVTVSGGGDLVPMSDMLGAILDVVIDRP